MRYHIIRKHFENTTFLSVGPSIVHVLTLVPNFLQVTITLFEQKLMHTLGRYTTLTPTHNLVAFISTLLLR